MTLNIRLDVFGHKINISVLQISVVEVSMKIGTLRYSNQW